MRNIKNKRHSIAAKRLNKARDSYNAYHRSLKKAKKSLSDCLSNEFERKNCKRWYENDIEYCSEQMEKLSEEIRNLKKEIYVSQMIYNYGNKK